MNVFSNHPSTQKAKAKTERKFWISPLNIERFLLGAYNSTFLLARGNVSGTVRPSPQFNTTKY